MMKNKRWLLTVALFVLVIPAAIMIKSKSGRTAIRPSREISPAFDSIQTSITATGTVLPQNRLEIKPPFSGRIEEIKVAEGEKIKSGQILAWMSSTERAALLDAARSQGEETLKYWQEVYKPTPLMAPLDGEVIVRAVEPGQIVTASDVVLVLSDRLIVKAQFDETDIGKVKLGRPAEISLDAYPQVKLKATIDHIAYESNVTNNVTFYQVDILPEQIPDFFRSGMSANVEITEKSRGDVLVVPLAAVRQDQAGSYVLLRSDQGKKPIRRAVEVGLADEKNVEVISGLGPEDKVIVEGMLPLSVKKSPGGSTNPLMPFGGRRH